MARLPIFDSPLLLGFERLEQMLDRTTKASADGYPPYNIEQIGENGLRITLAVAGFAMDDLSVSIEDNQLIVRGRNSDDGEGHIYLHRGIAARQFQRSFVLAEGIEVKGAKLADGLLHVDIERYPPEIKVTTIKIESSPSKSSAKGKTLNLSGE